MIATSQLPEVKPKSWFRALTDSGHAATDDADQRRQKSVFTGASFLKAAMCPLWCAMFVSVGGYVAGAVPLVYAAVTGLSIVRLASNKNIDGFRTRQAWFIFLAPLAVTIAIGGLHASSAVILWSFLAPLIVLLFHGPKQAVPWLFGFVALVVASLAIEVLNLRPVLPISLLMRNVFAAMNVIVVTGIVFITVVYYARLLEEGRAVQAQLREEVREARRLGQYHLERKLGEGGMGIVYEARHAMLRRRTAVKLLPKGRVDEMSLERFEREVQLTAELTHPNTVAIYDYGRTPDGIFYYAMELLEGCDLERLITVDGAQPEDRVVHILRQVAGALSEAHAAGLVHRDIKPANIILCERGGQMDVAKVVDFGLVKRIEGTEASAQTTGLNVITGTPAYLAPEAIAGGDGVDRRSDLYALGCVAFTLLTGRPPFGGGNIVEVCSHHLHTPAPSPGEVRGKALDVELEALVLACMAKKPNDRPASAGEILDRLERCASVAPWTQARASAWWAEHEGLALRDSPAEMSMDLSIDFARRA